MTPGDLVRIKGARGTYRVRLVRHDGSVDLWGGPVGRASLRTVTPDRIIPARRGDVQPASLHVPTPARRGR